MKTRFGSILVVVVLLMGAGSAGADATRASRSARSLDTPGDASPSHLDRRLALAMARMDENLMALLGPASLDCTGDFLESGLETCTARLDGSHGAAVPNPD
ncbi:hypothetical protein K2X89_11670 [Myxococcota bacterium]|nr:hypothetical protein [Myxococcota bacterium]